MKVKSESEVAESDMTPPSMGFSRQEYWSGVPLPSPIIWLATYYTSHDGLSYALVTNTQEISVA